MSLVFGRLSQEFVTFLTIVSLAYGSDDAETRSQYQAMVPGAQASFRHEASKDAALLVYIGMT
jgi:hypothetical protein